MKIHRSVSEKRTFRTISDQFISREFIVGRDIEIPDTASEAERQYQEANLLLELRGEVLTSFMLEGMMTNEERDKALSPYQAYRDATYQNAFVPTPETA